MSRPDLNSVLEYVFDHGGFTTRSDFARRAADSIAIAASQALISVETPDGGFGRIWRMTAKGLSLLMGPIPDESPILIIDGGGLAGLCKPRERT